jgi:hypothetical protein
LSEDEDEEVEDDEDGDDADVKEDDLVGVAGVVIDDDFAGDFAGEVVVGDLLRADCLFTALT